MMRAELDEAARAVASRLPAGAAPRVGLILGSGLGPYADRLAGRVAIPYRALGGFPASAVEGHAGNLVYGRTSGVEVLALQGRAHYYEGHDAATVAWPARVLVASGCTTLVVTNAAGGIDQKLAPGDLVVLRDHLNLSGTSPLRGPNDERVGPRFPDMTDAYNPALRVVALRAGRSLGLTLHEGIYAYLPGPSYETPAEIRMLHILGAGLCGMSTVPEVIAARHMGARVLGISCVTNLAAGLSPRKLSHDEVTETAARVQATFAALLDRILGELGATQGVP